MLEILENNKKTGLFLPDECLYESIRLFIISCSTNFQLSENKKKKPGEMKQLRLIFT